VASAARARANRRATAGEVRQTGGPADEAQLQSRSREVPTEHPQTTSTKNSSEHFQQKSSGVGSWQVAQIVAQLAYQEGAMCIPIREAQPANKKARVQTLLPERRD
jgi:hypothetical protein